VTVAVAPTPLFAVTGRLLGLDGRPLSGLRVNVQKKPPRDNFDGLAEPAQFEVNPEIGTAADGIFRTPRELEWKPGGYRVEVIADGYLPARSDWSPLPERDLLTLPDLTVKRSRGSGWSPGR
jgi:hypothetical protein